MMMLIERADAERDYEHSTHPRAATRIFQLLGHIAEMPTLPARFKAEARGDDAIDPADLPSQEEQEAFNREVVMPCFEDALGLAKAVGATTIIQDLGSADDFFKDVEIARLMDVDRFDDFKTIGAKEWADLAEFNAVLLERLGLTD